MKVRILTKVTVASLLILFLFCSFIVADEAKKEEDNQQIAAADDKFKQGEFDSAFNLYIEALKADDTNFRANYRIGYIHLLSNKFADAEKFLKKAMNIEPDRREPKILLAELYHRQDRFAEEASLLRELQNEGSAKWCDSIKAVTPYQIESDKTETAVEFVLTDPLPVFKLKVNEKEIYVLLDTGAAELILDTEFAKELGIEATGGHMGEFAGGKKAPVQYSRVDSVDFGDFHIKNVPVHMLPTSGMLRLGNIKLSGIVGTVFLYHFIPTIDYPGGKLILRKKTDENYNKIKVMKDAITMPFWMAGDHYAVAKGTANSIGPLTFFIDTGLAGGGFTLSKDTLDMVGIKLDESKAFKGMGGGGELKAYIIEANEITLGKAVKEKVRGVYTGIMSIDEAFGFTINGIVSHQFFRDYALTFNFRDMELYLVKGK
ncbi:MAG: aspartyl protease family protein [Acidobacteria bacterium]|nr:aspartyl protease family protein [Acidobacteriota bacterium]